MSENFEQQIGRTVQAAGDATGKFFSEAYQYAGSPQGKADVSTASMIGSALLPSLALFDGAAKLAVPAAQLGAKLGGDLLHGLEAPNAKSKVEQQSLAKDGSAGVPANHEAPGGADAKGNHPNIAGEALTKEGRAGQVAPAGENKLSTTPGATPKGIEPGGPRTEATVPNTQHPVVHR
jgi:hypothetical protein